MILITQDEKELRRRAFVIYRYTTEGLVDSSGAGTINLYYFYLQVKAYLKREFEKDDKPHDEPFYQKILNDIFHKNDLDNDGLINTEEYNVYDHDEL